MIYQIIWGDIVYFHEEGGEPNIEKEQEKKKYDVMISMH